jgi:hypothetical protein
MPWTFWQIRCNPISLLTGHVVSIHRIEPQSIVTAASGSKQSPAKKGASGKEPAWAPW